MPEVPWLPCFLFNFTNPQHHNHINLPNKLWGNTLSRAWPVFCMRCLKPKEVDGIYSETITLAARGAAQIYEASHIINTGHKCYTGHKKDEDPAEGLRVKQNGFFCSDSSV